VTNRFVFQSLVSQTIGDPLQSPAQHGRAKVGTNGSHVREVDSRHCGNDVYSVDTLTIVIRAKAGIHCCPLSSLAPQL